MIAAKRLTILFLILFILSFSLLFVLQGPMGFGVADLRDIAYFIPPDLLINDSWYGVYFGKQYIGYSHSLMKANSVKEGGGYLISNKTVLDIPILGVLQNLSLDSEITLDKRRLLEKGHVRLSAPGYFLKGTFERVGKRSFKLSLHTPGQKIKRRFDLSDKVVGLSYMPVFFNYLPVRNNFSFSYYDPFVDKNRLIRIRRTGTTQLKINKETYEAIIFSVDMEGVEGEIYTDKKGYLLKQKFLGFEFLKENPVDLFAKKLPRSSFDVIDQFTVSTSPIPDKERITYLKLKVEGIEKEFLQESFNQRLSDDGITVEIEKRLPRIFSDMPITHAEFKEHLAEDIFIKYRDNDIQETAREIAGSETDAYKALKLISLWLDKNIAKIPTVSIPNAQDVLKMKQGDCGEFSALMVAMLRSLGIPAYVNIGLVYQDGRFFYHAWVSAFVGEWIDTDPALNQIIADSTHIKLLKGLKGQFEIFKVLNKIKIEVLEYR